jgi:sugar phosphate isomerase/epimerase
MHRRDALATLAALSLAPALAEGKHQSARSGLGLVIHSYAVRGARPLPPDFPSVSHPLAFVRLGAQLGAAGVQTKIGMLDPAELAALREALESAGMYLEGIVALPKDENDAARFAREIEGAKAAGAAVVRTVCLSGRRYEQFTTAEQFQQFAEQAWKSLTLAEPIVRKQGVRLAVENHKDWRIDEMLGWLNRLSSEWVGVCLDTGNSIALLEDPHAVVDAYAPWTLTTHFKDMGVAEYDDGFLLSEVPLGDGFLDLPRIVSTVKKARPEIRFNLEMITRDPLRIPCLTPQYWATLGEVRARELADALARVRKNSFSGPLPTITSLGHREQLEVEAKNIAQSLKYANKHLQL